MAAGRRAVYYVGGSLDCWGGVMAEELRLWAMDGAGGAAELGGVGGTDSERLLEDTLVNNPGMLLPGLTLVGRQTRTEGGPLDLLGVDRDGRLALFELKRGRLNRDAVAQALDYGSWLESLSNDALADTISRYSGAGGVTEVGNFAEWYGQRYEREISEARPLRLFLVGLGADDTTTRMVQFLADRGVDMSLLTFLGFHHQGQTLLARQMPVDAVETVGAAKQATDNRSRKDQVIANVEVYRESWPEGCDLFYAVRDMFLQNLPGFVEGGSKRQDETAGYRINYRPRVPGPHQYCAGVRFSPPVDVVPYFLHLALRKLPEQFSRLLEEIPNGGVWPANASMETANDVSFGLTPADWETHKDKLVDITRSVYAAFTADETGDGMDENGGC